MDKKYQLLKLEYNSTFSAFITMLVVFYSILLAVFNTESQPAKTILDLMFVAIAITEIWCLGLLIKSYNKLHAYLLK